MSSLKRTTSGDPFAQIYAKMDAMQREIINLKTNKVPTIPQYDSGNMPDAEPDGHLAMTDTGGQVVVAGTWTNLAGGSYYKSTQKLVSDESTIVFDSIPQTYTTLRLEWAATSNEVSTLGILALRMNSDDVSLPSDYWWTLSSINPAATTSALSSEVSDDTYGYFGITDLYSSHNQYSVGHITIPDYTNTAGDATPWTGLGMASNGSYSPDTYLSGGWRQNSEAVTKITIYLFDVSDIGGTQYNIYNGSRFTLLGF